MNEAEREKELEIQNRHLEESKDSLRNLSQDKELPRDEKNEADGKFFAAFSR